MCLFVSRQQTKWLNVVLDLNGIHCECVGRSSLRKGGSHNVKDNIFSDECPTIAGTKAIYVRPGLQEFLAEISHFANRVVVWSSMLKKNAEPVTKFLFHCSKPPIHILGQEECQKIETSQGKFLHHPKDMYKLIYLKILAHHLFPNPTDGTSFSRDNTLLIDDSLEKSVCNERGNAIFLKPWEHKLRGENFLMESLAPWLRQLQEGCDPGHLRQYVETIQIGFAPMTDSDHLMQDILKGMRESATNLGSRFELPGMDLVIEFGMSREQRHLGNRKLCVTDCGQ